MKLNKITKNGTIEFTMSDGRIGLSYESGYVRVSTKNGSSGKEFRLYQINKKIIVTKFTINTEESYLMNERVLEKCSHKRLSMLLAFDNKNCVNVTKLQ